MRNGGNDVRPEKARCYKNNFSVISGGVISIVVAVILSPIYNVQALLKSKKIIENNISQRQYRANLNDKCNKLLDRDWNCLLCDMLQQYIF